MCIQHQITCFINIFNHCCKQYFFDLYPLLSVLNHLITDIISFVGYAKTFVSSEKMPTVTWSFTSFMHPKKNLSKRWTTGWGRCNNRTNFQMVLIDWEHNGQYQTVYRCYTWPLSQCQIFAWKIKSIIYSHIMIFLFQIFWGWLHFNNHLLLKVDFFFEDHLHLCS